MIKHFNNTAILTTQHPEVFFTYYYTDADHWIYPKANIPFGTLLVNGIDISLYDPCTYILDYSNTKALQLNVDNSAAVFHVYTRNVSDFDASISFHIFDNTICTSLNQIDYINIHYRPNVITQSDINIFENENILVDDKASYLILRTTPQLTGNIKLVVDTSNNMFLDTFKVSQELANRKYRKQQVSANSTYSNDIKNVFGGKIPVGDDLYKNDLVNTLNIAVAKTELFDQYRTTYNYGARLLEDELYPQDNALLAPLWLNSELPDYFCVFRMPGVFNSETYDGSSLSDLAFKYLQNSDIVKTWSFKTNTPLGTYLTTHLNDNKKYQAPIFLSLTDPSISKSTSDPNTWYGISVDKGIVTGKDEDTYVFNKNIYNLTKLNAYVSQGFMRNKLISSDLINFEYAFDDNDVSLYTMNRYFGLYLTENVLYKIAYYSDVSGGAVRILSLDGRDSSSFINSNLIFNASTGNINSDYKNRIFVLNDENGLKRITNKSQIIQTSNSVKSYVNKSYQNLFDVEVVQTNINPFITLTLNAALNQGDQLRIINKTKNKIWEIYGVNVSTCQSYVSTYSSVGHPTIYQTIFSTLGDISHQIKEIETAFDRFQNYQTGIFRSGVRGSNWMSVILNDDASINEQWSFQRITSQVLNNPDNPNSGYNTSASTGDISFFGRYTPNASEYSIISYDASYGPINFELYGNRYSIEIPLYNRKNNYLYSFYNESDALNKFENPTLYQGIDSWYKAILNFDVSHGYSYQYVQDPLSLTTKYLIQTGGAIKTILNRWNAYSIFPLSISLMGINPVKDIDYTVYDAYLGFKSEYYYKRDNDASTYELSIAAGTSNTISLRNSYIIKSGQGFVTIDSETMPYSPLFRFNTFNKPARIIANSNTVVTYNILDGSANFTSYKSDSSTSEEYINDYYKTNKLLNYSLTAPSIFKWVGSGTDLRGNSLRLILDSSAFSPGYSFVAKDDSQESTYPIFKYLTPGDKNWKDYIFYDVNDTVQYTENGISYYKTLKDLMLQKTKIDFFSKLVYSNNAVENVENRSTILYYNQYKNAIDTLFLGLSLSISANTVSKGTVDIKKYDKYRFSIVSTSSRNRTSTKPVEVIINENTETILIIWYQGNDVLNYTYRNSTYSPGKSMLDVSNNDNINYRSFITGSNVSTYYSFVKTPFIVNNSTLAKRLVNVYDYKTAYDSSLANPYAQLNYNIFDYSSIWNAFYSNANVISSNIFSTTHSYNTFTQYVLYNYFKNINTYGNYVVNYGYKYNSDDNLYANNTCKILTFKKLLEENNVLFYIVKEDITYTSNDFSSQPLTITINGYRSFNGVNTYNGWYKPKFDSILEFKNNEDDNLINLFEKDFTLSNTNLRACRNLDQVWYNKVVTTVLDSDTSNGISYLSEFNIFKALWDADYFIKRNESLVNEYIDGYKCTKELPSYFGSKLIKLPDYIELESWISENAYTEVDDGYYYLCYNLTKSIISLFNSNFTFISNWDELNITGDVLNAYIENTIVPYYYIDANQMQISYYRKPYDRQLIHYTYDVAFTSDDKQNFLSNLYVENDEYIYKIRVPKNNNYSYYVKIKLFEK